MLPFQSVEADDRIISYYEKGFVLSAYIATIVKWALFALSVLMLVLTLFSFTRWIAYPPTHPGGSDEEKVSVIVYR